MHVVPEAPRKPALHFGHLVSAVVIHDQMNIEVGGNSLLDAVQETQKLLMSMTAVAGTDHLSCRHIESSKQRGGSVAEIIVSLACGHAGPKGQDRPRVCRKLCKRSPEENRRARWE